jgi:hypothetical protein
LRQFGVGVAIERMEFPDQAGFAVGAGGLFEGVQEDFTAGHGHFQWLSCWTHSTPAVRTGQSGVMP